MMLSQSSRGSEVSRLIGTGSAPAAAAPAEAASLDHCALAADDLDVRGADGAALPDPVPRSQAAVVPAVGAVGPGVVAVVAVVVVHVRVGAVRLGVTEVDAVGADLLVVVLGRTVTDEEQRDDADPGERDDLGRLRLRRGRGRLARWVLPCGQGVFLLCGHRTPMRCVATGYRCCFVCQQLHTILASDTV